MFPACVIALGKNAICFHDIIVDAGGNSIFNEDNGRVEVLMAVTFFEVVLGLGVTAVSPLILSSYQY